VATTFNKDKKMKPFEAIQKSIQVVWGEEYPAIETTWGEWLTESSEPHILAAVFPEYALCPPEPFSMVDYTAFDKWTRVQELASEHAGRAIYFDSINPGRFNFYWSDWD
tara:strand:- start:117 stop:443 length:327 start_codon:yes stop_codon:yes gene_type:complete